MRCKTTMGALVLEILVARAGDGEIRRARDAGRGRLGHRGAPLAKVSACPAICRPQPRRLKERQLQSKKRQLHSQERQLRLKKRQLHSQEFRGILTEVVEKQTQIARDAGGIVVKLRIGEKLAGAAIGRIQIGRDLL